MYIFKSLYAVELYSLVRQNSDRGSEYATPLLFFVFTEYAHESYFYAGNTPI